MENFQLEKQSCCAEGFARNGTVQETPSIPELKRETTEFIACKPSETMEVGVSDDLHKYVWDSLPISDETRHEIIKGYYQCLSMNDFDDTGTDTEKF